MLRMWRLLVPTEYDPLFEMDVEQVHYPDELMWADRVCPEYAAVND